MPYFMIVSLFFKPFLDNKMSIFEEYGAFSKFVDNMIIATLICFLVEGNI